MAQNVKFYFGTQAKYDALVEKDSFALYFIEDTQRLYKGSSLQAVGAEASETASGLLSAEDYKQLQALIENPASATLVPADSSITIIDDTIGVRLSAVEGNIIELKEDGLYVKPDEVTAEQVDGLDTRLQAVEKSIIGGIHYKGSVPTVDDLPTDASQGDLYEVEEDHSEWCFNGTEWVEFGSASGLKPIAYAEINEEQFEINNGVLNLVKVDPSIIDLSNKVDKVINNADGSRAMIFNEPSGGGAMFTNADGSQSYVGVSDGGIGGMMAQIYADKQLDDGRWVGSRINVYHDHIYYTSLADKEAGKANNDVDCEIATKGDIALALTWKEM